MPENFEKFESYMRMILIHLDTIGQLLTKLGECFVDKEIKSAKKSIDKKMDKLAKDDKKRDKKCEHAEKIARKNRR
jgi:hypothetical protein